jgi:hypothetical protein
MLKVNSDGTGGIILCPSFFNQSYDESVGLPPVAIITLSAEISPLEVCNSN